MSKYFRILGFYLPFVLFMALACSVKKKEAKTPALFDLNNPEKFTMPSSLLEVSGISFANGNNDTLYLVQDEAGKLFRLSPGVKKAGFVKFGKNGDYEDVTILRKKVIVLKSNGTLYSFPANDAFLEQVDNVTEWKNLVPDGEYEGLFGDETSGYLYLLCKKCDADSRDEVSGFILHTDDLRRPATRFRIHVSEIRQFSKKVKSGFRPSGLAKDPLTNEWFIVSAANKLLVIADSGWKVKAAYPLNGNTFYQPEGVTFDSKGNLYISNEGDELSDGNVLKFIRRTQ